MNDLLIRLDRPEMAACAQAASLRMLLNRAAGVKNQRRSEDQDDADVDLLGIKAEQAVAKAYGLSFNPYALGIDAGQDLWAGQLSIDVKASFHPSGRLAFKHADSVRADALVFVTAAHEPDVMKIAGWVTAKRFLEEAQVEDFGTGRALALSQDRLSRPETLWRMIVAKEVSNV